MAKASSTRRATSPEVFRIWSASSSGNSIMTCIVGTPHCGARCCLLSTDVHSAGMDVLPWHPSGSTVRISPSQTPSAFAIQHSHLGRGVALARHGGGGDRLFHPRQLGG